MNVMERIEFKKKYNISADDLDLYEVMLLNEKVYPSIKDPRMQVTMKQSELCEILNANTSSLSRSMNKLIDAGLIKKHSKMAYIIIPIKEG